MLEQLKFNGARVIITGAGQGIGESCAEALGELGAHVVLVVKTLEKLERVKAGLDKKGVESEVHAFDVSVEADVLAFRDKLAQPDKPLKALINNAGTNLVKRLEDLQSEEWHRILGINLHSIYYLCKAFMPLLEKAPGGGSIVNVASTFGVIGFPSMPVYCASKGAILSLTRQLAIDYGPKGVRTNSLCPGPTL